MGKGDKRSKKGKITINSYGVNRPRPALVAKKAAANALAEPKAKKAKSPSKAAKPAAAKKVSKKKADA